jgi:hypothetical protein
MMLDLIKGFFCIYWDDQVVFVFASVNVVYYVYWFSDVEPPLQCWDEASLVMVNHLFDVLLNSSLLLLKISTQESLELRLSAASARSNLFLGIPCTMRLSCSCSFCIRDYPVKMCFLLTVSRAELITAPPAPGMSLGIWEPLSKDWLGWKCVSGTGLA